MAYSELVKSLDKMRSYLREFYVYGFKTQPQLIQPDVRGMNTRSNDYVRQRVDSWLGGVMTFQRGKNNEPVFLSADSREVAHNPLYAAFRAKSFTDNDLVLHFMLLAVMSDGAPRSVPECLDDMQCQMDYLPEEKTLRKKMDEYAAMGILQTRRSGQRKLYTLAEDQVNLAAWSQALGFYTEVAPLGVIGSYFAAEDTPFAFKHHFLQGALDSEILLQLLTACGSHCCVKLTLAGRAQTVYPVRIYSSVQTGRQYLLGVNMAEQRAVTVRIDRVERVLTAQKPEADWQALTALADRKAEVMWGVSSRETDALEQVDMLIRVEAWEEHIRRRLLRECRCGQVEQVDADTLRFTCRVNDAAELLPWVRSLTGRIIRFRCSNAQITERLKQDWQAMAAMYGGVNDG